MLPHQTRIIDINPIVQEEKAAGANFIKIAQIQARIRLAIRYFYETETNFCRA